MIYAAPGSDFTAVLQGADSGLLGDLGWRLERSDGTTVLARTAVGIVEAEAGSGVYIATGTAPDDAGTYVVLWDTGGATPVFASEELVVTHTAGVAPAPVIDGLYTTPVDLRAAFTPALDADVLPDAEALKICADATTLVDDRLGPWPVDEVTGRKIAEERVNDWQWAALRDATTELAKYLFTNPGVASEGRYLGTTGDVSTSGAAVDGPYGELFASHLRRSQLVIGFTRARRRGNRVWDRFARQRD